MASYQNHLTVSIILLALMQLHMSESFGIRESDYEIHVKNSNGKTYIAHVIDQLDLVVKLKCVCTSLHKCNVKNMIILSK